MSCILALALLACGKDPVDEARTASRLRVREVLSEHPPPCGARLPAPDGPCLALGAVIFDGDGVVAASRRDSLQVELRLGAAASAALDRFASASRGRRVAFLVDGVVLSAPSIHERSFGGYVVISFSTPAHASRLLEAAQG